VTGVTRLATEYRLGLYNRHVRGVLENIGWLLGCVYSTIPAYWFLVHPFAALWRKRKISLKHVGWVWPLLWVLAGAITVQWRHISLYREPLTWVPGVALIAVAMYVYSRARRDFSEDQVLGRSELEPEKHEQRLVTTGIRSRIRHPYYLAHLCHLLGWTVGTGSAVLCGMSAFAVVTGAVMIQMEERELEQRFGDEYHRYQASSSAIIPVPRSRRPATSD